MEKLTELKIKNTKCTDKDFYIREGNGFVLRVRKGGSKTFYFIYDYQGKRKRLILGTWPVVTLADAREKHLEASLVLKRGEDPSSPPPPTQITPIKSLTVKDIADDYITWSERHHTAEWHKIVSTTIKAHLHKPEIIDKDAKTLKRRDVIQLLDAVAEDRPGMARTLLRVARGVFELALQLEKLEVNPFANLKLARTIPSIIPTSRERVLSDEEIRHVWEILNSTKSDPRSIVTRRALMLILITGQRPNEVAGMMFEEISENWWTIPAERAKNKKTHRLYLSPLALSLIGPIGSNGPVFVGLRGTPLTRHALSHFVAEGDNNKRLQYFGLPRWTPHDLRRTCATKLASIECPDEVIDAILNHVKKGIIATYNRHHYDNKKKEWLLIWSSYLEKLVNIKNQSTSNTSPKGGM